jgi:hypothetical protein
VEGREPLVEIRIRIRGEDREDCAILGGLMPRSCVA